MFFTPDLLQKRDSGFGLLWLAATLGPKSNFRKLAKRSILTADIPELCQLITTPPEPLALRLSSNLMVGVVRVYKVKHEIFSADVTSCFATLKKTLQEIQQSSNLTVDLQMHQPTVRPDTITIRMDPAIELELEFGLLDPNHFEEACGPTEKESRGRTNRNHDSELSILNASSQGLHLLNESHDFFSSSFDADLNLSSMDDFPFGNEMFPPVSAGHDQNVSFTLGDELAREAGGSWLDILEHPLDQLGAGNFSDGLGGRPEDVQLELPEMTYEQEGLNPSDLPIGDPLPDTMDQHGEDGVVSLPNEINPPFREPTQKRVIPVEEDESEMAVVPRKKRRIAQFLVDERMQLTDEELKRARQDYALTQARLRFEGRQRQLQKDAPGKVSQMIWGVPRCFAAPQLIRLWRDRFKMNAKSNSGYIYLDEQIMQNNDQEVADGEQQQTNLSHPVRLETLGETQEQNNYPSFQPLNTGIDGLYDMPEDFNMDVGLNIEKESSDIGQARGAPSRSLSVQMSPPHLHSSNIKPNAGNGRPSFPWNETDDNNPLSLGYERILVGGIDSDVFKIPRETSKLFEGRDSSSTGRRFGSVPGSPLAPAAHQFGADFTPPYSSSAVEHDIFGAKETQASNESLVSLERSSHKFLEYAQLTRNALAPGQKLTLDELFRSNRSRSVAAAGLYHTLVLSTKGLLRVQQDNPYGPIGIDLI